MSLRRLWRPVGAGELELIRASGMKAFPPRLEWQPIFYPVLNFQYAAQIAREWNTNDSFSGFAGYVTTFQLSSEYLSKFEVQIVGDRTHEELWVPAEELSQFNAHIQGEIEIVATFYGNAFSGERVVYQNSYDG